MEEIYTLITQAQQGDAQAKERIVTENSGLIWSIVRRFKSRGYELEDLYQIGAIGLLKCIEKFDMSYGVKFSTYAVPMIMGEIKRFLRDDGMIKVSRPLKELAARAACAREALTAKSGTEPTIGQLAEELCVGREELVYAMESARDTESIYSTVYHSDGSSVYLLDKLRQEDDGEKMIDMITVKQLLSRLEPSERQIIMMRYFDDKTQSEIAAKLGISQVQVSRAEKRILNGIREKLGRLD